MLVEGGFGLLPHPGRTSEVVRRLRLAPSEGGYCDFPEPGKGWLSAKGVTWSKALGWNCPSSRLYPRRPVLGERACQRRCLQPDLPPRSASTWFSYILPPEPEVLSRLLVEVALLEDQSPKV